MENALLSFEHLWNQAKGKQLVVFLDFDGTLAPIVARPELAKIPELTRKSVEKISQRFITAIVSGRSKDDVKKLVGLNHLYYAGNHGFDIEGPPASNLKFQNNGASDSSATSNSDSNLKHQVALDFVPVLQEVYNTLKQKLEGFGGVILENNKFSLSVHYRLVQEQETVDTIFKIVDTIIQSKQEFKQKTKITHGKKVIEIRANYDWHKGKAVLHLLQYLNLFHPDSVFAIYLGDDKTDEDAFHALKQNNLGIGILVADGGDQDSRVKQMTTSAQYYVNDTLQVVTLLDRLSIEPLEP